MLPGFNFNAVLGFFSAHRNAGAVMWLSNDKVCDDQLRIYGDFYYADVKTHDELAPSATGPFELPGQV